jgi:hypothetical protein
MRRREFIAGLGNAAAWPLAARAQQRPVPVIGILEFGAPGRTRSTAQHVPRPLDRLAMGPVVVTQKSR